MSLPASLWESRELPVRRDVTGAGRSGRERSRLPGAVIVGHWRDTTDLLGVPGSPGSRHRRGYPGRPEDAVGAGPRTKFGLLALSRGCSEGYRTGLRGMSWR